MNIWDTAGDEKFRAITSVYYRDSSVALLLYDVSDSRSFNSLDFWMYDLAEKGGEALPVVLVANKNDLESAVSIQEVNAFLSRHPQVKAFLSVSVKADPTVDAVFEEAVKHADPELFVPVPSEEPPAASSCC